MRAREARKIARDAHAAAALECCGVRFGSKVALKLHQLEHKRAAKNRLYPD
jgi:hypothetical protein